MGVELTLCSQRLFEIVRKLHGDNSKPQIQRVDGMAREQWPKMEQSAIKWGRRDSSRRWSE